MQSCSGPRAGGRAALRAPAACRIGKSARPVRGGHCRCNAGAGPQPDFRDTIKALNKLFYQTAPYHGSVDEAQEEADVLSPQIVATDGEAGPMLLQRLPLWRVEWVVLPGQQSILHVHAPHYAHMFEALFMQQQQAGQPLLFGHLLLPEGSRNLGGEEYGLQPDSDTKAPLVGTLMEVTRCVRMVDGKLLILATGVARFQVVSGHQELPYSVADVQLYLDEEELHHWHWPGADALMSNKVFIGMERFKQQAVMAAEAGAAAQAWRWINSYELTVARRQAWAGQLPREGANDMETVLLVQELAAHGVSDVLALPDGVVTGRVGLEEVARAAQADAQAAMQQAALRAAAGRPPRASASYIDPASTQLTERELAAMERALWEQLDMLAGLEMRVSGKRIPMPYGLLQLRPPPSPPGEDDGPAAALHACGSMATAGEGGSTWRPERPTSPGANSLMSLSSLDGGAGSAEENVSNTMAERGYLNGAVAAQFAGLASDGLDVHADPLYPQLRRVTRLSYAAASVVLDPTDVATRQLLLECPWVYGRLEFLIDVLAKRNTQLAALAAMRSLEQ